MNNDAFRALVNDQRRQNSSTISKNDHKSTKEIAREAVQEEFRRKRRGGGGRRRGRHGGDSDDGGYGSSSDEEGYRLRKEAGAADKDDNEPQWKRGRREKKQSSNSQHQTEYRDRAKERREGTNLDYAALDTFASNANDHTEDRLRQAELSKYLGGDEEHTHLVKGLDLALAQKVRREEMGSRGIELGDGDLDRLLEEEYEKKKQSLQSDGGNHGENWRTIKPKNDLGRSVINYLLRQPRHIQSTPTATIPKEIKTNPAIQKSIQRTVLEFSLECDTRRRNNAWEVPQLSIQVVSSKNDGGLTSRKGTHFDHRLIQSITKALDESRRGRRKMRKASEEIVENLLINVSSKDVNGGTEHDNVGDESESKDGDEKTRSNKYDSDEDIFDDVDDNYAPPSTTAESKASSVGSVTTKGNGSNIDFKVEKADTDNKKPSIFDNLITNGNQTSSSNDSPLRKSNAMHPHNVQRSLHHNVQKNVIDRDIIGGKSTQLPFSKRRGPTSAAIEGVSFADYQGGYGEEMDMDFGNDDDDNRKYSKQKNNNSNDCGNSGNGDDDE